MKAATNMPFNDSITQIVLNAQWFSPNPDRAWAEKFFLLYSPIWMALMALMMLTGWTTTSSDGQLLLHAAIVATPLFIVPALLHKRYSPDLPWHESYWFKANLYMFLFGFFGNYFGSEYFFDVLGMVYNFPNAETSLDAKLVGQGHQPVPLIMYFYTHAYFMTYHTSAVVVLRRIMSSGLPLRRLLFMPVVFVVGYVWAWLETRAMANPLMATSFYYEKMDIMLAYGSMIYSTYFIASFPIFYFLDETAQRRWSWIQTTAAGMSASMLTFYLLDACAHLVGRL
jgi:cycloeucalenol cycloisomerase